MKRYFLITILLIPLFYPWPVFGQESEAAGDEIFKARVVEVLEQNIIDSEDSAPIIQQQLKLRGLDGTWQDKEFVFNGTKYEVISSNEYKEGDKVMAVYSKDLEGNDVFYITDYVRNGALYWLAGLFALVVILVGRLKGLRALVVLLLTFLIILYFIIPRILAGADPLLISIVGSLVILVVAIYLTEGFKRTSTIAIASVIISLIFIGLLSIWFTSLSRLTGFASDEAIYLMDIGGGQLNLQGLLLAGIIIGTLGVLDDVAISQIFLVRELKSSKPDITKKELFKKAMRVGISHMSSMVNTLFLAYAGAALPLLILFSVNEPPFISFGQALNNEMIATEIVRTLTGSIGLVLAVPLATALAIKFIKAKKTNNN